MTVTCLMAITANGYIAGENDDTDWVKDIDALNKAIADMGVVILGKRTYDECVKYDSFPYKGATNIVMTHSEELQTKTIEEVIFTDKSPSEVLQLAASKGFEKVLLIGGGHLNGSFLQENLIDELIVDVHPLLKASGIKLFETSFKDVALELVSSNVLNDQIVQIKYKIRKTA